MAEKQMIRLAKPYISEEATQKVTEVLRSGNLVQGENVRQFEEKLEHYLNVKHVVVVSSGTAALHLSLLALDIGHGDEVIVPAFTYPATANVVEIVGAKPVFVDITLDDFCIDAARIEEAITDKTKAVIPVHEFGQAADMDPIMALAKQNNLQIVEDAACALGSEYKGKKTGTIGNMGCFSFHPRKAITTGEGGAIVTNDSQLADKVRSLRNHGTSIVNDKIEFEYAGLNYRMTDFQAALGIAQLNEIDFLINHRIKMAKAYDDHLMEIEWIKTSKILSGRKPVYQTYHLMVGDNIDRDSMITALKKNGIETNIGAYALPMIKYYRKKYNYQEQNYPSALNSYRYGLALPIGSHINITDIQHIYECLSKSFYNLDSF